MSRLVVVVAGLFLSVGCKSSPEAPSEQRQTPPVVAEGRARPPVQLSWKEVELGANQVSLIAQVQRAPLTFPIEVSVALPDGATLTEGRAKFTLAPNAELTTDVEAITVSFAKTPATDLELHADGEVPEMGIHAVVAYRFGRPPPLQPVVKPSGPDLKVGDKNLGPSIPIKAD